MLQNPNWIGTSAALAVAVATPAPATMVDVAMIGARHVHDHLPQEIRERLPEDLRLKITGS